jgi:low temperature requirement protein LtrA
MISCMSGDRAEAGWRRGVLRQRGEDVRVPVTHMELYFDLVYVFAFTQLSEYLYQHLTVLGGLQTLVMLLALWWAWSDTAWATGWIDPESGIVVTLMAVLMLASVVAASTVLDAFHSDGLGFALTVVTMQALRVTFMLGVFPRSEPMRRHYQRSVPWAALASALWVVGGVTHGQDQRLLLWALAAAVALIAPLLHYWVPSLGATPSNEWTVSGRHLAERCQLMLMVAFGETILRLGEAAVEAHGRIASEGSFVIGFTLTFAMSMSYFLRHAAAGERVVAGPEGRAPRLLLTGYTYSHTLLIAATVAVSVAIHRAIEHPAEHVSLGFALVCLGSPAVYYIGLALWRLRLGHAPVLPALASLPLLAVLGIPATAVSQVTTLAAAALASVILALWMQRDLRTRRSP